MLEQLVSVRPGFGGDVGFTCTGVVAEPVAVATGAAVASRCVLTAAVDAVGLLTLVDVCGQTRQRAVKLPCASRGRRTLEGIASYTTSCYKPLLDALAVKHETNASCCFVSRGGDLRPSVPAQSPSSSPYPG